MQSHDELRDDRKSVRIRIFADKCIGAGHCVAAARDVFAQNDDDGVVILLNDRPALDRYEAVKKAARMCPTLAIEVLEP